MAYGLSNDHVTVKGRTRDPNTLRAQYLENYLSYRLQIWCAALYQEYRADAQIIFPESGRGPGHVTPTIFGSTVGYLSDSLASCMQSLLRNVRIQQLLSHFYGIYAIRIRYSNSYIQQLHKSLTICLVIRSSVSEYHTYNICNFARTYDGQTAEKVCPTYPPIYRYGATPSPSNLLILQ